MSLQTLKLKSSIPRRRTVAFIGAILLFLIVSFGIFIALKNSLQVQAVTKDKWSAGNIIADSVFMDSNSMSVSDIQAFLDKQIGTCDTYGTGKAVEYGSNLTRAQYAASRGWQGPPYTCLNLYYEVPKKTANSSEPVTNYSNPSQRPEGSQSAAWLIKDAANTYNISPKVLLVKLATESAGPLTSDKWPLYSQYKYALGARCPDSGAGGSANCDANYAGFSIQIYEGARLLRWYLDSMDQPWWSYKKPYQTNSILWNVVQRNCGASNVYIENKATAALYTYTPYQPNDAALNNMYGTGDNCSAYGNRNFWRTYWDWFGQTRTSATVYTKVTASTVDTAGGSGRIEFSLSQRPVAEVVLVLTTSNDSLLGFQDSKNIITIQPDDWNKPERNSVTFYAKDSSLTRASNVYVKIKQIGSPDINFSYIDADSIGAPSILWQPTNSKVYRLFSPSQNKHIFTSRDEEITALQASGYSLEGDVFQSCPAGESSIVRVRKDSTYRLTVLNSNSYAQLASQGYVIDSTLMSYASYAASVPIYELQNNANNFIYTKDINEANYIASNYGYTITGTPLATCPPESSNPVYRLFSQSSGSHFYTRDANERILAQTKSGYTYEAVQFYANSATSPVYRFFSPTKKSHFFTISETERAQAKQSGYTEEGVAFYALGSKTTSSQTPTYRLYNSSTGKHFFTTSSGERDDAVKHGFAFEGIAWYQ